MCRRDCGSLHAGLFLSDLLGFSKSSKLLNFSASAESVTEMSTTQRRLIRFVCKNNECEITPCVDVFRQTLIVLQAHVLKGEFECVCVLRLVWAHACLSIAKDHI